MKLRIPVALSVVVVATATVATVIGCTEHGKGGPVADANENCFTFCVPGSTGSDADCPFPTCATGSNMDQCPAGCIPEPVA